MIRDPKHIVTPFAFQEHKYLPDLNLAIPKPKTVTLLIDLVLAPMLSPPADMAPAFVTIKAENFLNSGIRKYLYPKEEVLSENNKSENE